VLDQELKLQSTKTTYLEGEACKMLRNFFSNKEVFEFYKYDLDNMSI